MKKKGEELKRKSEVIVCQVTMYCGYSYVKEFMNLLFFLGLISVNLAVINFLPIPIVDGGLMVFLLVEKLKGSPVSPWIQTAATVVGLAVIASIFLMTLYFDIGRIMGNG